MKTWDVTTVHGRLRAWQALCHELMGAAAALELDVDRALALAHGRSSEAVERLEVDVFSRVPGDVKLGLPKTVLASTPHPRTQLPAEAHLPFCVAGLQLIFSLRNAAAHAEVSAESTGETLVLMGRHRGRHQRHE